MGKLLYDGWHKIEEVITENARYETVTREKLHLKSAVAAIVTDAKGKIGLVRQFRPAIADYTFEIPAGVLDNPKLTPLGIITQELYEECAITEDKIESISWEDMPSFHMVVGSSDATISLCRVTLKEEMMSNYIIDDADVETAHWISFDEFERLVYKGKIKDGKTLLAYYILKDEFY